MAKLFGVVAKAAFHPLINKIRPSLNQSRYLAGEELYLLWSVAPLRWLQAFHLRARNNYNDNVFTTGVTRVSHCSLLIFYLFIFNWHRKEGGSFLRGSQVFFVRVCCFFYVSLCPILIILVVFPSNFKKVNPLTSFESLSKHLMDYFVTPQYVYWKVVFLSFKTVLTTIRHIKRTCPARINYSQNKSRKETIFQKVSDR